MPKEVTHWLIASRVADRLKGSPVFGASAQNPYCLKVGAVFHDLFCYKKIKNQYSVLHGVTEELHGVRGEDTYRIIKVLLAMIRESKEPGHLIAFFTGVVSHIFADSIFHPMVYYHCGSDYDPRSFYKHKALRLHRRFEALIDIYFLKGSNSLDSYLLRDFVLKSECSVIEIMQSCLESFVCEELEPEDKVLVVQAFSSYITKQGLLKNKFLGIILFLLERFCKFGFVKDVSSSFYIPGLEMYTSKVSGKIDYKNPVTGSSYSYKLDELFSLAVEKSVEFCLAMEPVISQKGTVSLNVLGPSLISGIQSSTVDEMKFFT